MVTRTELPSREQTGQALKSWPDVKITLKPPEAFALIALLKLALRHPDVRGPIADAAVCAIKKLKEALPLKLHPVIDQLKGAAPG